MILGYRKLQILRLQGKENIQVYPEGYTCSNPNACRVDLSVQLVLTVSSLILSHLALKLHVSQNPLS